MALLTPKYGRGSSPMTAEEQEKEDEYASYLLGRKAKYEDLHRHDNGLKATIFELSLAKSRRRDPRAYAPMWWRNA